MKVLSVNQFYGLNGGSDRCFHDWNRVLVEHGHQFVPFAMRADNDFPTEYRDFFVSNVQFFDGKKSLRESLKIAARIIYFVEARRKVTKLVELSRPEIAHLHIIYHQLSPSILPAIKGFGIPIVQTLHDYKRICPTYHLASHDRICERCKKHKYYHAVLQRCNRGSFTASLLNCVEMYVHKALQIYERNVDLFISPSHFLKDKMLEFGFKPKRFEVVPNFIVLDGYEPNYGGDSYFVHFGRLVRVKGLMTLMEAMSLLKSKKLQLYIIGRGYMQPEMEAYCKERGMDNVKFLGWKSGEELKELIRNSLFTIMPSEWYENYPLSLLESLAMGKPVLVSNIGGMPEMIVDGVDGLICKPGDPENIAEKIDYLFANRHRLPEMGRAAREKMEREYTPERYYDRVMKLYHSLLS
jgi:glycosyltransferase involved in cell wall biosynthesis